MGAEVDWRDQGVITSVRDQGRCGSCWAFASSSVMGSYAKISDMSHDLLELSPQQLVSCAPNPLQCGGAGGCQGSVEPLAFTYVSPPPWRLPTGASTPVECSMVVITIPTLW